MTQAFSTISPIILIFLRFFSLCCHSARVTASRNDNEDHTPIQGGTILTGYFGPGADQEPSENPIDVLQRRIDEAARMIDLLVPPAPGSSSGPQHTGPEDDDDAGAAAAIKQRITDALKRYNVTSACNAMSDSDLYRERDARPTVTYAVPGAKCDGQLPVTVAANYGPLARLERELARRASFPLSADQFISPSFLPADMVVTENDQEDIADWTNLNVNEIENEQEQDSTLLRIVAAASGWHIIRPGGGPQWPDEDGSARPESLPSFLPLAPSSGAALVVCQQREQEAATW